MYLVELIALMVENFRKLLGLIFLVGESVGITWSGIPFDREENSKCYLKLWIV